MRMFYVWNEINGQLVRTKEWRPSVEDIIEPIAIQFLVDNGIRPKTKLVNVLVSLATDWYERGLEEGMEYEFEPDDYVMHNEGYD